MRSIVNIYCEQKIITLFILRLIQIVADIQSTILFVQLVLCAVTIAMCLFSIDANGVFSMAFIASLAGLNSVLTPTFAYCLLSENVTWNLHLVANHFYDFAWYHLPAKQQKLFVLPIRRAQREFRMTGHGIIPCSLSVFSSVNIEFFSIFFSV